MTTRETTLFVVLTAAVASAVIAFAVEWARGAHSHSGVAWLVLTLILSYHLALWVVRWCALARMHRPIATPPKAGLRVGVATTFVPGGEPLEMLEQTVRAMVALDYPHDTWVLDEGNDPAVQELCARVGAQHFSRAPFARYQTAGGAFAARTKHGNYNAWLDAIAYARYDVVVNLDTDHVPESDFLLSVLGYFRDPTVGYVQAPQSYYNQDASFIARGAAEETYAYHSIQQMANFGVGETVIVGCHATHRVSALRQVGGFPAHDAEDLLLTSRYRAAGWRGIYVPRILALGTTAVDWPGYLRQQLRWARSTLDVKLRAYREAAGRLSPTARLLVLFHGSYYLRPLTIPVVYGVVLGLLIAGTPPPAFSMQLVISGGLVAVLLATAERFRRRFFLDPRREGGLHWRATLMQFAKWPVFLLAVWHVLMRQERPYALTMKVRSAGRETILRRPHVLVAVATATAWALGHWWHGPHAPAVTAAAAAIITLSLAIALTEQLRFPTPFESERYARRRAEHAALLGRGSTPRAVAAERASR